MKLVIITLGLVLSIGLFAEQSTSSNLLLNSDSVNSKNPTDYFDFVGHPANQFNVTDAGSMELEKMADLEIDIVELSDKLTKWIIAFLLFTILLLSAHVFTLRNLYKHVKKAEILQVKINALEQGLRDETGGLRDVFIFINKANGNNTLQNKIPPKEGTEDLSTPEITQSKTRTEAEAHKTSVPTNSIVNPDSKWVLAYSSQTGLSHLNTQPQIPCQDSHLVRSINEDWGIAIVSDGAGSAKYSHLGSAFIVQAVFYEFEKLIKTREWIQEKQLPSKEDWKKYSKESLKNVREELLAYSEKNKLDLKDVACTVIVVVYSPYGLLCSHIGDGRAGFRNEMGEWHSLLEPHKGDEANETIFITSQEWLSKNYLMSGVEVPESITVSGSITAFTLMTDGCEKVSFDLGKFDEENQKFIKKNKPYAGFLNPLTEGINKMQNEGKTQDEILSEWDNFLANGIEKLAIEQDDKTLILGVIKDLKA